MKDVSFRVGGAQAPACLLSPPVLPFCPSSTCTPISAPLPYEHRREGPYPADTGLKRVRAAAEEAEGRVSLSREGKETGVQGGQRGTRKGEPVTYHNPRRCSRAEGRRETGAEARDDYALAGSQTRCKTTRSPRPQGLGEVTGRRPGRGGPPHTPHPWATRQARRPSHYLPAACPPGPPQHPPASLRASTCHLGQHRHPPPTNRSPTAARECRTGDSLCVCSWGDRPPPRLQAALLSFLCS